MRTSLASVVIALPLLLSACAASSPPPPAMSRPMVAAAEAPVVIEKSPYAKDITGTVSEDDLQRILSAHLDLQLPGRLGIVPLSTPFDPRGVPTLATRDLAARAVGRTLLGNPNFSTVTDVSTDIPHIGGIEGLRVIAARYRVRYLLLCSQKWEDDTHLNGWAFLYPTVLGLFLAPGVTVASRGYVQADLLDARTGTLLFTVVEPMSVSQKKLMVGAGRSHREAQEEAAIDAAKRLGERVIVQTNALVAFADSTKGHSPDTKFLPPPVVVSATPEPIVAATTTTTATTTK
jgi:hypothetical protein